MNKFNFLPEGWNTEKYKITSNEEIENFGLGCWMDAQRLAAFFSGCN